VPSSAIEWLSDHPEVLAATAAGSLVMFVGTLVVVPILLVRMRADYFTDPDPAGSFHRRHPVLRASGAVLRNLLGAAIILVGLLLLVLPGQGLLSILVGVSLLDFPGKRRVERRIAMQRHVRRSIDWIRRRRGHPPLDFGDDQEQVPDTP
jgi:hypothetical protein